MKKTLEGSIHQSIITTAYLSLIVFCLSLGQVANAIPIDRVDFSGSAVTYGFDGETAGTTTVNSDILTVSQGVVSSFNWTGTPLVEPTYNNQGGGTATRLDFLSDVSAIGLDFVSNNATVSLSIFDSSDTFLESIELSDFGLPLQNGFPSGFVGLDTGVNNIAYALFDTPYQQGFDFYIDNIIYQQVDVPEPSPLVIMALGLLAIGFLKRKDSA